LTLATKIESDIDLAKESLLKGDKSTAQKFLEYSEKDLE